MGRLREDLKLEVIRDASSGRVTKEGACGKLGVGRGSVNRYITRSCECGPEGLRDKRSSNYIKLSLEDERRIVFYKLNDPHRSNRFAEDELKLRVREQTVWRIW